VTDTGHRWYPTKHPIVLSEWRSSLPYRNTFTTVMNWTSYKSITYCGRKYGQKDVEFLKFISLPQKLLPTTLEVALHKPHFRWSSKNDQTSAPLDALQQLGWCVVDSTEVCLPSIVIANTFRDQKASGVLLKMAMWRENPDGLASFRLLSGRRSSCDSSRHWIQPSITRRGGVLSFNTFDEAEAGMREVEGNYNRHAKAARQRRSAI
jgi:hypothetical protein